MRFDFSAGRLADAALRISITWLLVILQQSGG